MPKKVIRKVVKTAAVGSLILGDTTTAVIISADVGMNTTTPIEPVLVEKEMKEKEGVLESLSLESLLKRPEIQRLVDVYGGEEFFRKVFQKADVVDKDGKAFIVLKFKANNFNMDEIEKINEILNFVDSFDDSSNESGEYLHLFEKYVRNPVLLTLNSYQSMGWTDSFHSPTLLELSETIGNQMLLTSSAQEGTHYSRYIHGTHLTIEQLQSWNPGILEFCDGDIVNVCAENGDIVRSALTRNDDKVIAEGYQTGMIGSWGSNPSGGIALGNWVWEWFRKAPTSQNVLETLNSENFMQNSTEMTAQIQSDIEALTLNGENLTFVTTISEYNLRSNSRIPDPEGGDGLLFMTIKRVANSGDSQFSWQKYTRAIEEPTFIAESYSTNFSPLTDFEFSTMIPQFEESIVIPPKDKDTNTPKSEVEIKNEIEEPKEVEKEKGKEVKVIENKTNKNNVMVNNELKNKHEFMIKDGNENDNEEEKSLPDVGEDQRSYTTLGAGALGAGALLYGNKRRKK